MRQLRCACSRRRLALRAQLAVGWWSGLLGAWNSPAELHASAVPTRGRHEVAAAQPAEAPAKGGADSLEPPIAMTRLCWDTSECYQERSGRPLIGAQRSVKRRSRGRPLASETRKSQKGRGGTHPVRRRLISFAKHQKRRPENAPGMELSFSGRAALNKRVTTSGASTANFDLEHRELERPKRKA